MGGTARGGPEVPESTVLPCQTPALMGQHLPGQGYGTEERAVGWRSVRALKQLCQRTV